MSDNAQPTDESEAREAADKLMVKVLTTEMTDNEIDRAGRKLDLFNRYRARE